MEIKEAIKHVDAVLIGYLKSGSTYPNHAEEIRKSIIEVILQTIPSPEAALERHKANSKISLDSIVKVKGMPARQILGDSGSQTVNSSGKRIEDSFDRLKPKIVSRYDFCMENFTRQSKRYFDERINEFTDLLMDFLKQVPAGGSKDKLIKDVITEIKQELRYLEKWTKPFGSIFSFQAEVENIFAVEGGAIAAKWAERLTPGNEFEHDHSDRNGQIYLIRGNWALEKGLIKVGSNGFTDEITQPSEELGCPCRWIYRFSLRDLPDELLTEKGRSSIKR
jgi:hypothetical protein